MSRISSSSSGPAAPAAGSPRSSSAMTTPSRDEPAMFRVNAYQPDATTCRSIKAGCLAASHAVAKTSPALRSFIREVREARPELDAVLGELQSLEGVLELLRDDAGAFPPDLARRTPPLLEHCAGIVQQIEGYMHVCNGLGLTSRDKKFRWMAIKGDMDKLRLTLEGYKSILAVVTDLVGMSKACGRRDADQSSLSSDASGFHRALEEQTVANEEQKQDLTRVTGDMGSLRGRLQGDFRSNYAVSDLESYLDAMLLHATQLGFRLQGEKRDLDASAHKILHHGVASGGSGTNSTSGGDAPDSAIDLDGPPSPYGHGQVHEHQAPHGHAHVLLPTGSAAGRRSNTSMSRSNSELPMVEIEEFLDELTELPDQDHHAGHGSRPPTPPPKASRRNSVKQTSTPLAPPRAPEPVTSLPLDAVLPPPTSSTTLSPFPAGAFPGLSRPESMRSVSEYSAMLIDSEGHAVVPRRVSSLRSLVAGTPTPGGSGSDDARSTIGSLRATSPLASNEDDFNPYGRVSTTGGFTTTTILGGSAARDSMDSALPPPIKDKRLSTSLSTLRMFGRKNSVHAPTQPARPASSLGVRGSQLLHALHVPSVLSPSSSRTHSPSRAGSIRDDINSRPATALGSTTTIRERGTHVLNALAGPAEEDEEDEYEHERTTTTTPSSTESVPTPFVTNISSGPVAAAASTPTLARRKHSVDTTSHTIQTQSSGSRGARPSTAVTSNGGASIRSNSSRISSMFRRVSLWRPRTEDAAVPEEDAEPDDIFGVSLKKSMQMASSVVRTHHDGAKASSRRQFPRCALACVNFIRNQGGVYAPNIFGGDMGMPLGGSGGAGVMRVAALKEKFSMAPSYGAEESMDWAGHDVYDAAELLVLFLQQLPRPLVTETVAKRWIVMSKQATLPGSMGLRLDECIDFWDEALLGVRGAARDLFKLLLNLWGDVADAADANDMTAERLAARLLNPLMHLPAGKYTTDYMLGLAFLIRKRSEYSAVLRGGRKSKAAF